MTDTEVMVNWYPDPSQQALKQGFAKALGVDPTQVIAGCGADEILDVALRVFAPTRAIVCPPTFGMYATLARVNQVEVKEVVRTPAPNFAVDVAEVVREIGRGKPEKTMVFIASPNNPTGGLTPLNDLVEIASTGAITILDEAYIEFSHHRPNPSSPSTPSTPSTPSHPTTPSTALDSEDGTGLLSRFPNVVIVRTLSKWAGLAGLRVGYGLAHPCVVRAMDVVRQPYNVNVCAEAAALKAIALRAEICGAGGPVATLTRTIHTLSTNLTNSFPWLTPIPTAANFLLVRVRGISAEQFSRALLERGVMARFFGKQGGELSAFVRFSAGREKDMKRLMDALVDVHKNSVVLVKNESTSKTGTMVCPGVSKPTQVEILKDAEAVNACARAVCRRAVPDAILFDMDGVLADVSNSYRECIVRTAQHFGVTTNQTEIESAKLRGGANNDWELTLKLISEHSSTPPTFDQVREVFQRFYLGTEKEPGLCEKENLLVERELIVGLAATTRLAVVTGRPRDEAFAFLKRHKLDQGIFGAVICMEDSEKPKPHPEPVMLACRSLGLHCSSAVMLGDTVDDVRAAVSCGCFALGVLLPSASPSSAQQSACALVRCGAEGVLSAGLSALKAWATPQPAAGTIAKPIAAPTTSDDEPSTPDDAPRTPILRQIQGSQITKSRDITLWRPAVDDETRAIVQDIVKNIREGGETEMLRYAVKFGELSEGADYVVTQDMMRAAFERLPAATQALLQRTAERIRSFASAQRHALQDCNTVIAGGTAGHTVTPVEVAGCYAPGGRYPLPSTVLMTVIPARVAGCSQVIVTSPKPTDVTLGAAFVGGADLLFTVGGAQAIAAMAFGCGKIPQCNVIVGPGNKFVTAAKALVVDRVGIDMLAGPSEVLVIADDSADPALVAADLIAQAEHDPEAMSILVTQSQQLATNVQSQLNSQLLSLKTREVALASLTRHGLCVMVDSVEEATTVSNLLAPEHLEIHTNNPHQIAALCSNYGAVFIGRHAAEVLGDYGAGPNHTLPTAGTAKNHGGLSVLTFLRVHTWINIDNLAMAQRLVQDAESFALLEGLEGHAAAARQRLISIPSTPSQQQHIIQCAIPKGRMNENVLSLMKEAGVNIKIPDRVLRPVIGLPGWTGKLVKPRDCVRMLHLGLRDVGFSGMDLVRELDAFNVVPVLDTGLDPVKIVAAVGSSMVDAKGNIILPSSRPLRIATEYERLTTEWVRAKKIHAIVVPTSGATEVYPPEDADMIVDNTATGTTLQANNLVIVDTLLTSSTHLVASRAAYDDPVKRAEIDKLKLLLESVLQARNLVLLEFNVPSHVSLDEMLSQPELNGLTRPTIAPLYGNAGHAVKTAVKKSMVPQLLVSVRAAGGTDVLVTHIHHLVR